ncbi:uncharacterized protein METZ01_LOCUS402557 [marine metagenome]|uniref:Uncharacterized protein n=1 Tax=marine metagenome TaxID=408172 RepID=A0A382VT88_9ZZZZ
MLECTNSLLEWYMFTGTNLVRGITESAGVYIKLDPYRLK